MAYDSVDPAERVYAKIPDSDFRNPFGRDRDRILYSSAFRRLAGVTQVAAVREHHLLHNRLTHSLKVAQVGRRIAQRLLDDDYSGKKFDGGLGIDSREFFPDVVEAAGLAHDLGHPPFGHVAEEVLADKMDDLGGFEGNAQSFRVVTKLAVNVYADFGLDLTRATLNAILKYPRYTAVPSWKRHSWLDRKHGNKWGAYKSEERDFTHARAGAKKDERSAAAMLMDWADDVSYVTHDLQDYFRAGLMPLQTFHFREDEERFFEFADTRRRGYRTFDEEKFKTAYGELAERMPQTTWRDTYEDRRTLDKLMHRLIGPFFDAVESDGTSCIKIKESAEYEVEVLKQLTFFYVIKRPVLAMAQEGQKKVIGQLFDELVEIVAHHRNGGKNTEVPIPILLDEMYDGMERHEKISGFKRSDPERRARAVCDFICTLTEDQALNLYERITGLSVSHGSIFGAWFH